MTNERRSINVLNSESFSSILQAAEDILDKLKCLDYEDHFVRSQKLNLLCKEQLFLPGRNTGLQFQYFLQLTSWLFSLVHENEDDFRIDQYDDPNTIVHKIVIAVRELGLDADFPATKLKIPYGEAVVKVLDFLTELACERTGAKPGPVEYVGYYKDGKLISEEQDNARNNDEIFDESFLPDDDSNNSEDERNDLSENTLFEPTFNDEMENSARNMIESNIDPIEWRNEVERVGPKLRAAFQKEEDGWRNHLEQTVSQQQIIYNELPFMESQILLTRNETSEILERIKNREEYLNNKYTELSQEFAQVKDSSIKLEESCHNSSQNVTALTQQLATLSYQLDEVKKKVDEKSTIMSDTSPIVQIKAALQTLKKDIKGLELRIGVVNHTIQSRLQEAHLSSTKSSDENSEYLSFESESESDDE